MGQPLTRGCDVIGLQMQPPKALAAELVHTLRVLTHLYLKEVSCQYVCCEKRLLKN